MATAKNKKIYRGTGRRKNAIAAVILKPGSGKRTINGRDFKEYFHSEVQDMIANLPFAILGNAEEWDVEVTARGGGIAGQMGAVRLGIARALVANDAEVKPALKKEVPLNVRSSAARRLVSTSSSASANLRICFYGKPWRLPGFFCCY